MVVVVEYCPVCSLPTEYCEYGPSYEKCKQHASEHGTTSSSSSSSTSTAEIEEKTSNLTVNTADDRPPTETEKKGEPEVKLLPGGKKKKTEVPSVTVARTQRNKRKFVTTVTGLESFGIKLGDAAKLFAKKFSCGSSVVKGPTVEEIDVQGDVLHEIVEFILEKYEQIDINSVFMVEDGKKTKAHK
eukprot:TRINITY_DN1310_c7_g1_i1.p1 TRINITY_DN1310_c7_g1~~TRINITY_DN1310_c7_g1_i1.p1  ORF type:complete len:186 (+),score=57.03 TRINITY_DN1310_c7_g1_i1:74-631(+)